MKTILILLCLVSVSYAASPESQAFWKDYEVVLEHQVQKYPKGLPVKLELRDGTVIYGTFKQYVSYNESIWINTGNILDEGFEISEVLDIKPGEQI
jgi:hypothetical protein